jgi:hypothetical protein
LIVMPIKPIKKIFYETVLIIPLLYVTANNWRKFFISWQPKIGGAFKQKKTKRLITTGWRSSWLFQYVTQFRKIFELAPVNQTSKNTSCGSLGQTGDKITGRVFIYGLWRNGTATYQIEPTIQTCRIIPTGMEKEWARTALFVARDRENWCNLPADYSVK